MELSLLISGGLWVPVSVKNRRFGKSLNTEVHWEITGVVVS